MDPAGLIPSPDTIPVAWGWFEALLLATFAVHLLFMNAVLGGAVFSLSARSSPVRADLHLAGRLPTVLALTVNLGVPPLLFLQVLYGQFLYTSSILSATYWLSLVALTMAAYALLYVQAGKAKRAVEKPAGHAALALAVLALLAVSFIMSNVMSQMVRPQSWVRYFDNPGGTLLNLGDPTLVPRWLHFLFASLAVGGLFTALVNGKAAAGGDNGALARRSLGLKWFAYAGLLQAGAGLWWLMALPQDVMLLFMGGKVLETSVFLAALAAAGTTIFLGFKGWAAAAAAALALTVMLMVGVRELVRMAMLAPYFHPSGLAVSAQYGPMLLFAASMAAGAAAILYMLKLHRQAGGGT